ncbi:hypothetical protein Pmani_023121 [Petrolisthes manimaculis]|uniref:Uncharacterized protein n=1 Tax=Petrolisthes manimaculis TaxID=1843537 RepID=A0AAE1PAK1_9EUCA|nr:hypothetical protein Pmani_023121 [Petrolisthes manimaculis]
MPINSRPSGSIKTRRLPPLSEGGEKTPPQENTKGKKYHSGCTPPKNVKNGRSPRLRPRHGPHSGKYTTNSLPCACLHLYLLRRVKEASLLNTT